MKTIDVLNNPANIEQELMSLKEPGEGELRYFKKIGEKELEKAGIRSGKIKIDSRKGTFLVGWALSGPEDRNPEAHQMQINEVIRIISSCNLSHAVISGIIASEELKGSLCDWDQGAWLEKVAPVDTIFNIRYMNSGEILDASMGLNDQ